MKRRKVAAVVGIMTICTAVTPAATILAETTAMEAPAGDQQNGFQGGPQGMQEGPQGGPQGMQGGPQGGPQGMQGGPQGGPQGMQGGPQDSQQSGQQNNQQVQSDSQQSGQQNNQQGQPDSQQSGQQNAPQGQTGDQKSGQQNNQQGQTDGSQNGQQSGQQMTPPAKPDGETSEKDQNGNTQKQEEQKSSDTQKPSMPGDTGNEQPSNGQKTNDQKTNGRKADEQNQNDQNAGEQSTDKQADEKDIIAMIRQLLDRLLQSWESRYSQMSMIRESGMKTTASQMQLSTQSIKTSTQNQTPPEKPDGEMGDGQTPPEKPDGEMPGDGQTPPEKPDGEMGDGQTPPDMPEGGMPGDGQTPPEMPGGENGQQGGPGMPGGGSSAPTEYDAANKVEEDADGASYESTADSENAVLVDGKNVTLSNINVSKTGSSDGEDADFYGINAGVLADNGADLTITGAEITTDGTHANGVFSYGEGTSVTISDSTITTTGNNSGGVMTTGGASLTASNLTVSTSGNSSAAIRSDRGGGTVTVTEGSYSAAGVGSPAIYSTADITVSDATLNAGNSEAVVIEGGNSVTLNNVDITGNNATLNGQSTINTNVLIYQSMSGDAQAGNSTFTMNGGSMTAGTGAMFHVTNVTTEISLSDVAFTYAEDSDDFMILSADSWGNAGSNGGNATVNLSSQTAEGNIVVDADSSLALNLTGSSSYTGAINSANAGKVTVSIEDGSTWTLTGDSYIDSLDGSISSVDLNGYHLYIGGEEAEA